MQPLLTHLHYHVGVFSSSLLQDATTEQGMQQLPTHLKPHPDAPHPSALPWSCHIQVMAADSYISKL